MNAPPVVTLTLPMLPTMEVAASQTADAVLRYLAFPPDAIDEVKHALIEACINAFEHSRSTERMVHIAFEMGESDILVVIRDHGGGFDPEAVPVPLPLPEGGRPGERRRGWGLQLIRALMDDVQIHSGPAGTRLTMRKRRPAAPEATP